MVLFILKTQDSKSFKILQIDKIEKIEFADEPTRGLSIHFPGIKTRLFTTREKALRTSFKESFQDDIQ